MTKIRIIQPYDQVSFGRFVVNKRDMQRRSLLVENLNPVFSYFRKNTPKIFEKDYFTGYFLENLNKTGKKHFETGEPLSRAL
ncbi:MAG: hypothetical protein U9R38_04490 [Candidatus Margulisiibacteriota bacterium]|nr:hypothetical protein [Candidatus Margulisiibacteriota bacterium]